MDTRPTLVVGIGASAGGIPAIQELLANVPAGHGMSFVVVMHLSSDHPSHLATVLASKTDLRVEQISDGDKIRPDTVHVIPPGQILEIQDSVLHLRPEERSHRESRPIDVFFASLAEDQGEDAVGILLSGANSDGTLGIKQIKETGGITIAQSGNGPDFAPKMPESAIAVGLIDFAEEPSDIPARLLHIQDGNNQLQSLERSDLAKKESDRARQIQHDIAKLLKRQTGHPFSGYKQKTFLRRVMRRMKIHKDRTPEDYLERLRADPEEGMDLFRDLLINVTGFFRDPDAFEALRTEVIPRLFKGRLADATIRIWVPGCATGEEVFSLGILFTEYSDTLEDPPAVQIFATDIDEQALSVARAGRYPKQALHGLSQERIERFFENDAMEFTIAKRVRDMCVFSAHSIISHPPFSRMDLVSCRNLLIYLGQELQEKVIPTFHYALRPGGYLFLGTSESVSRHRDLFKPVDQRQRLFQARETESRFRPAPRTFNVPGADFSIPSTISGSTDDGRRLLRHQVEQQVLERHSPPHVAVTAAAEILYFSAGTGAYLEFPRGAPSRQLFDVARRDLRIDLRTVLRDVKERRERVQRIAVMPDPGSGEERQVLLTAEPMEQNAPGDSLFLVVFETLKFDASPIVGPAGGTEASDDAMERELRDMRERLQTMVEEYETALEELRASNEELVASNEEAQSANEELEASKEEMQSLNEELSTINNELSESVSELDQINIDLKNLYAASEVAAIFLDEALFIRSFTPAAKSFFNLRESDLGRPLTELSTKFDFPELQDWIASAMECGATQEKTLTSGEGNHHLLRIGPYHGSDDDPDGAIVTIVDVTRLIEAEKQKENLIGELNHRVKNMLTVVMSIVKQTNRTNSDPDQFTEVLIGRLHGLSRAYALMSEADWSHVTIEDIISAEAAVHEEGRFDCEGPEINLGPQETLALGTVLHELATNAMKYGALCKRGGKVTIRWEKRDDVLKLSWRETGGPPIEAAPEENGFGLTFVAGQVMGPLGGSLETGFPRDGFWMTLTLPL